jgi:hypothetical protein
MYHDAMESSNVEKIIDEIMADLFDDFDDNKEFDFEEDIDDAESRS